MTTHTVEFDANITYTGAFPAGGGSVEGVRFTKNAVDALDVQHITNMATPTSLIEYNVTWAEPIVEGDVIYFIYASGSGEYTDGTLKLNNQNLLCANCADGVIPPTLKMNKAWSGQENCA